jgi:hypothetical protein
MQWPVAFSAFGATGTLESGQFQHPSECQGPKRPLSHAVTIQEFSDLALHYTFDRG